jgi:hypothetical protein
MPYIGKSPLHGNYQKLDDFSGDFGNEIPLKIKLRMYKGN